MPILQAASLRYTPTLASLNHLSMRQTISPSFPGDAGILPAFSRSARFSVSQRQADRDAGALSVDLSTFRSERRGDERDFGLAQDTAPPGAVRVLDRNDSHRFWFRAAP